MGWFSGKSGSSDDTWRDKGAKEAEKARRLAIANRRLMAQRRIQERIDKQAAAAAKAMELVERRRAIEIRKGK